MSWPPASSPLVRDGRWKCCGGSISDAHSTDCPNNLARTHVTPLPKGKTREPQKRRSAPMQPVRPDTTEGSTTEMSTTKKRTAKRAQKRPAKRQPKKAAPELDTRALPWSIEWESKDGTCKGASRTGDWGNARYRIKGYLDTLDATPEQIRDELAKALDDVKAGRNTSAGPVKITLTKR